MTNPEPTVVEQGYDAVYGAWPHAPTLHRLWRQHVTGPDYPEGFEHISFATPPELARLAQELQAGPGQTIVDLACGAGGSGLWVARTTGAHLTGVDFSSVGVDIATQRSADLQMTDRATFAIGSFAATGLGSASADAAMTLDALQYAPSKADAAREVARILRPGGRFAFYAFVLDPARLAAIPGAWPDPVEDYGPVLAHAGLNVLVNETTAGWQERVTSAYEAVVAAREQLLAEMGERAANALMFEMTVTLEHKPYRDRVFVVAEKPQD